MEVNVDKECYFDFGQMHIVSAHQVEVFVRNGNRELQVGDIIGGRRIIQIKHHGREMDFLGAQMIGKIRLDGVPLLTIAGPHEEV
jgi:hypothetical protein